MRRLVRFVPFVGLTAVCGYLSYVAWAWSRYGRPAPPKSWDGDDLLDRFMPAYDVCERHHVLMDAPPAVVLAAAREQRLSQVPLVRAIFWLRERILRSPRDRVVRPQGLLALTTSLGWVVLAERSDREVVVGAVTKPWEPNVTFRGIPPAAFAAFNEPGYVKIVWTLRANPAGPDRSIFRTETRAVATDDEARAKFRRYWACFSPGIIGIRWLAAARLKSEIRQRRATVPSNFESAIQHR